MIKKANSYDQAWDPIEQYDKSPRGFIQWKGTEACVDYTCECGETFHEDGDFLYEVTCPSCGSRYICSPFIELIQVK